MSQPTISRTYGDGLPLVEQATCLSRQDLAVGACGRVLLADGIYVPTRNRTITGRRNYSGKHHVPCLNVQIAATTDGTLLAVSDPVPGARHDSAALDLVCWATTLDGVEWIANSAYIAHGTTTSVKKTRGTQRTDVEKN